MDKKQLKILYVNGGLMDRGGVSSVMMNYYKHFDLTKIHVDFLVHGNEEGERDAEIIARNGRIFRVPPKSKNPMKNYIKITEILKKEDYDIVHAHADSGNAYILKIAKKCGVLVRISHSHNTYYTIHNKLRIWINDLQKKRIKKYATQLWACSQMAANWLYGKNQDVKIIYNAIELDKFKYSKQYCEEIRDKFRLHDRYVIGMIGRLDYQKNHKFALQLIDEIRKDRSNVVLLIIGDGCLRKKLEDQVELLQLQSNVIFCGQVDDIYKYYSAIDLLIMPSLFEGLPVSIVEAQCAGVPCVISDNITREVAVLNNVRYLPLEDTEKWKDYVLNTKDTVIRDENGILELKQAGFNISTEAEKLQNIYFSLVKQVNN